MSGTADNRVDLELVVPSGGKASLHEADEGMLHILWHVQRISRLEAVRARKVAGTRHARREHERTRPVPACAFERATLDQPAQAGNLIEVAADKKTSRQPAAHDRR